MAFERLDREEPDNSGFENPEGMADQLSEVINWVDKTIEAHEKLEANQNNREIRAEFMEQLLSITSLSTPAQISIISAGIAAMAVIKRRDI